MTIIEELSRRRVFRVAGIYLVGSWVITEITSVVAPALMLPEWTLTLVIVLLLCMFPIAMLFAWIYDITPSGVERTAPKAEPASNQTTTKTKVIYVLLMLVALGLLATVMLAPWKKPVATVDQVRNSVAVLPFANMSGDQNNDYFSDGMSEELLNLLAKVPDLQVAARTSSFAYRDTALDIREVAQKLNVETVLEGSVRWASENQIRITAQLIDAESGFHLWTDTYDVQLENIFEIQDRIAKEIVKALQVTFTPEQETLVDTATAALTLDVQAYDMYLRGRNVMRKRGLDGIQASIDLFQAAVGRDPGFARAYAGLASAYVVLPNYGELNVEEAYSQASNAAVRALTLDASLGEAHAVLAQIKLNQKNWSEAETGFFAAIGLDADEPTSYHWYSNMLQETGRLEAALENMQQALELDPESPVINGALAGLYTLQGEDDLALSQIETTKTLGFGQSLSELNAIIQLRRKNWAAAAKLFTEGQQPLSIEEANAFALALSDNSKVDAFFELIRKDENSQAQLQLFFCMALNDLDCAFDMISQLREEDNLSIANLWMPEAEKLRQDPRFVTLMVEVGLVDYWRRYGWSDFCSEEDDIIQCQ